MIKFSDKWETREQRVIRKSQVASRNQKIRTTHYTQIAPVASTGETPKITLAHQTLRSTEAKDARECLHRTVARHLRSTREPPQRSGSSTGDTPARHCPHQFTNSTAQSFANTGTEAVGVTTNSPPTAPTEVIEAQQSPTARELAAKVLGCSTWVELAQRVDRSAKDRKSVV